MGALKQFQLEMIERLRTSDISRSLVARCLLAASQFRRSSGPADATRELQRLCRAARLCSSTAMMSQIESRIGSVLDGLPAWDVDWLQIDRNSSSQRINKGVILKPFLGDHEKGVLFISFENQMLRLRNGPLEKIAEQFVVVVSPSWSPPHNVITSAFPRIFPGEMFCLISNLDDLGTIPRISERYHVVPLFASSWVDPDRFHPLPKAERDIDLLMVANFGAFKRHYAFFKALRDVPKSARIVLIGQDQDGRTRDTVYQEATYYGVGSRIEIRSNCQYEEVAEAMCRSRATTVFSLREGSCVVVAESLFADTPVALIANAAIGSSAFINGQTGRFLDPSAKTLELGQKLVESRQQSLPRPAYAIGRQQHQKPKNRRTVAWLN